MQLPLLDFAGQLTRRARMGSLTRRNPLGSLAESEVPGAKRKPTT